MRLRDEILYAIVHAVVVKVSSLLHLISVHKSQAAAFVRFVLSCEKTPRRWPQRIECPGLFGNFFHQIIAKARD